MASFQPPSHLFERNISLNDLDSALDVREIVRKDVVVPEDATRHRYLDSSSKYSFVLPSFQDFAIEFRKFVYSFLVDGHIMRELEAARRLNWGSSLCRMVTVNTLGDGNCLMHAASIGMWAVNDRYQILRKTVYEALVEDVEGTRFYHGRWKSEEEQQILNQLGGYKRTEEQWSHEWEEVIRHVSQTEFPCGPSGAQFGSLEEIHIFVLANILRRTIIVLSDDTLRGPYGDSYSPINFGGIYLPLLWDSVDCVKSPLVIGYANGHFTAVVSIKDGKLDLEIENQPAPNSANCMHAVPLVKYDGSPLPVHFLYHHEAPLASDRLRQYLDCARVTLSSDQGEMRQTILVARLHFSEQPPCMKALIDGYFQKAREEYQRVSRNSQPRPQIQPGIKQPALQIVECQTEGCTFYGSTETGNRCSKCLNEYLRTLAPCEPSQHVAAGQIPARQQVVTTTTMATQQASNASVTSPSMTLPVASHGRCRTSGCKYAAVFERGGLCERCSEAERSAEEMAASPNLALAKFCSNRINGCEFFGLPEHHNLCSRCYRTFCLRMENTLGSLSPTGLRPSSPPSSAPPNRCQSRNCPLPGVPALYGMCVQCYTGCIHNFITSKGESVGSTSAVQSSPCQQPPPENVRRLNPVATGGRRKGVLCASPGCCNEGVFQFADLCEECHRRKAGPSPQVRNTTVSTAGEANIQGAAPSISSMAASAATAAPTHQLTSALTNAIGYYTRAKPACKNPMRRDGQGICENCGTANALLSNTNPAGSLQQPARSVSVPTTASSVSPRQTFPAFASARSNASTTLGISSSGQAGLPHQASAQQVPSTESNTGRCAMGCGKPAEQEGGLCKECFSAGYQAELRVTRETGVSQASRQQGAVAAAAPNNQGELSNIAQGSSARNTQQAESATTKKAAVKVTQLPCTSTGCLRFGTPEKNGLCEQCYLKKGNTPPSPTSRSEANQTRGPGISGNLRSAQNSMQNRQFGYGSYELPGPVQVSQTQSPPYGSRVRRTGSNSGDDDLNGLRCRGTNCNLFGTPETNGYCSRCFLESTIPLSYPHSVPDFPAEVSSSSVASHAAVAADKCIITGCDQAAAPERHGHCQQCFARFYPDVVCHEVSLEN